MSTLILGITLEDLAAAIVCLPFVGALVNLGFALCLSPGRTRSLSPLIKTLGIGAPLCSFILLGLIPAMMPEGGAGLILGPYLTGIVLPRVLFDLAFWLDPLTLGLSLCVLGGSVLIAWYTITANSAEDLARTLGMQSLMVGFLLLVVWTDSLPWLFVAWEGLALVATVWGQAATRPLFVWVRLANGCFLIGMGLAVAHILPEIPSETYLRLTFTTIETYRAELGGATLYWWLLPAAVYAAQFPAALWLSRASETPAPTFVVMSVFGLLSAAVYLVLRLHVLILADPTVWYLLEGLGAVTALYGALSACGQGSGRRTLAYALVSAAGTVLCVMGMGAYDIALQQWIVVMIATTLIGLALAEQKSLGALMALIAGVSLMIGLFPLGGFAPRYEILWHLFNAGRLVSFGMLALASLLLTWALSRLVCRIWMQRAEGSAAERGIVINARSLLWGLLLFSAVAVSVLSLPEFMRIGSGLKTWFAPVFEDHLPIRSELYGRSAQWGFAMSCLVSWWLVAVLAVGLSLRYRDRLGSMGQRWCHWVRRDFYGEETLVNLLIRPLCRAVDILVRDLLDQKLLNGLLISGTASGVQLLGRGIARLQTGRLQQSLIWFLIGAGLFLLWVQL